MMPQQNLGLETDDNPNAEMHAERDNIREVYRARLAEKLKNPDFRKIEGFPIGTDEAILALSDPPYYTACPNPFIEEWLAENARPYNPATDNYHREPFAADVSEGKNDPIYNAHSYHTKVPHKAIMRYILHYTEPGDVVYDGFCGTGMTGVAAQMCGDKAQVESLGYTVCTDGTLLDEEGKPFSKFGARKAILNDLSPAATFIAYNYNTPVDAHTFEREAKRILKEVEEECGWMYSILHDATPAETERIAEAVRQCQSADKCRALYKDLQSPRSPLRDPNSRLKVGCINYTIWSDIFICPNCGGEIVFWDAAVDPQAAKVAEVFCCSICRAETTKKLCERTTVSRFDTAITQSVKQAKQIPVIVNYAVGKKRYQRVADIHDLALADAIEHANINDWFPTDKLPHGYNTEQPKRSHGLTHAHHFFTRRNLASAAKFLAELKTPKHILLLTGVVTEIARFGRVQVSNYFKGGGGPFIPALNGTLYISSLSVEKRPMFAFENRLATLIRCLPSLPRPDAFINTASTTRTTNIRADVVDYIFTDPPFGGNIMYSELNFLWEAWLQVKTNNVPEAITNETQKKKLHDYQELMTQCFANYYRLLKPGRWMTVEFHNSANAVWNAIQEGLERVGFVIADVRTLDKLKGSFKQVTTSGATKVDLVISCYKPHHDFEARFRQVQGKPEGVVEFLREHLAMLPVAPVNKAGRLEAVAERTRFLLFDRMVAYHLQRGARIPLSAAEFYNLLEEQFVERDEMYFLNEQSARYDAVKARGVETEQLSIFVRDEKTAVQWVRGRLSEQTQTLGDLVPKFMQELREWESHEPRPELRDLLKEYFVEESGVWHVPDPNSEKDLEGMRHNALLRLFREYTNVKGPLKVFRKEAVMEGFRYCWDTQQYGIIVAVCEKIPEKILQEIQEFVMMYDIAKEHAQTMEPQTAFVWE
jgi:DNA modification methylase